MNYGQQTLNPTGPTSSKGGRPRRDPFKAFRGTAARAVPGTPYKSAEKTCDRTGRVMVWSCPGSGQRYRMRQACTKLDCQTCYPRVARRRGARAFEQLGGVPLGAFVFTVPHELRYVVGLAQAKVLRGMLAKLLKSWARARWGCDIGFRVAFHPSGDRCASCGFKASKRDTSSSPAWLSGACPRCDRPPSWSPHFDVLMPMFGLRSGRPYRLPFKLSSGDLAAVKVAWSELVLGIVAASSTRLHERTADLLGRGLGVVDYRFRLKVKEKRHRLRYSLRPFPAWSNTLGRGLGTPQAYGLAAPNSKVPGIAAWRLKVSAEPELAELLCTCCPVPQPLELEDVVHELAYRYRAYSSCPWLDDSDP